MAPPNTLYIPTIERPMAQAAFFEVMKALDNVFGLIDFIPDALKGGDYVHIPNYGQVSAGLERADVAGTLTTGLTARTFTKFDQIMAVLHRTQLVEFYTPTVRRANVTVEQMSAEIGRQAGIKAAIKLLADIYIVAIAAADSVVDDHDHEPYVDSADASLQVDFSASVLQAAKFLLADHMNSLDVGVVNSKMWNDLTVSSLSSTFNVPNIMGDVYREGQFGRVLGTDFIIDDQVPTAAGPTTNSPLKQQALLFRSRMKSDQNVAPVVVSLQKPLQIYEQHVLGQQAVKLQRQVEFAYAIGIRGKTYDVGNGGVNPSDAALATATNWDDAYADHREVGIALLRSN